MKRHGIAITLLLPTLCLLPVKAAAQDWFEGIYTSWRVGTFIDHPTSAQVAVEAPNPRNLPVRSQPGFEVTGAFGLWLRFGDIRMRTEFETGYQRAQLEARARPSILRADEGRGYKDAALFLWNQNFHFLPRASRHQPWAGFGLGFAYQRRRFYWIGRQYKDSSAADFALAGAFGYDYRLTDQFGVGVQYRYVNIFDRASDSRQSQVKISLSYGF